MHLSDLEIGPVRIVYARVERVKIGRKCRTLVFDKCNCRGSALTVKAKMADGNQNEIVCSGCLDKGHLPNKEEPFTFTWEWAASRRRSYRFPEFIPIPPMLRTVKFDVHLARKLCRLWTKRFGLDRHKLRMMDWKKFKKRTKARSRRTQAVIMLKSKVIIIRKDISPSMMWPAFVHELAHIREHGHTKAFGEEMKAVSRFCELQIERLVRLGKIDTPELVSACNLPKELREEDL